MSTIALIDCYNLAAVFVNYEDVAITSLLDIIGGH